MYSSERILQDRNEIRPVTYASTNNTKRLPKSPEGVLCTFLRGGVPLEL